MLDEPHHDDFGHALEDVNDGQSKINDLDLVVPIVVKVPLFIAAVVTRGQHQRVRDDAERDKMIEQAMQD